MNSEILLLTLSSLNPISGMTKVDCMTGSVNQTRPCATATNLQPNFSITTLKLSTLPPKPIRTTHDLCGKFVVAEIDLNPGERVAFGLKPYDELLPPVISIVRLGPFLFRPIWN